MESSLVLRYVAVCCSLLAFGIGTPACTYSDAPGESRFDAAAYRASRPRDIPQRRYGAVDWEQHLRIGGVADDTVLTSPIRLSASSDGVFLIDYFPRRVTSFSHTGELRWTLGRKGGGPNEFADPRDLKVGPEGNLWVMDSGNARLTIVSPDGDPLRNVPLTDLGSMPFAVTPMENGRAVLVVGGSREKPFVMVDPSGNVVERFAFPWSGFAQLDYIATQVVTAHDAATDRWAAAFTLGDGFFTFKGDTWDGYHGWFVEHVDFPQVSVRQEGNVTVTEHVSRPPISAAHITMSPSRLYVLFGGTTDERHRILDSFSLEDGSYAGSYLLPKRVMEVAWYDGGIYTLANDPYPELAYWRPAGDPLP